MKTRQIDASDIDLREENLFRVLRAVVRTLPPAALLQIYRDLNRSDVTHELINAGPNGDLVDTEVKLTE